MEEVEDKNTNTETIDTNAKGDEKAKKEPIPLSRKMRWIVFVYIILITVFMGFDQGILSSTTSELKAHFNNMTDTELGGLGGMVFLGNSFGCVSTFAIINVFNRKYILLASMCLDVLSLLFTTQTKNILILYSCRVIAGIAQSFLSIYSSVWSDQFGIHKKKSMMLALIHIFSSVGYLLGYALGILIGWKISFYIQNIILIIHIVFLFIFLPNKYFSTTLMPLKAKFHIYKLEEEKEEEEQIDDKDAKIIDQINNINMNINETESREEKKGNLIDEIDEEKMLEEDNQSLFEDIETKNEDLQKESFITHLKVLIKSPIYLLMNGALTSIFIFLSAVQFWINDYMENSLFIENKKIRLYCFAAVIITSPPVGIFIGGFLSGKVGGYDRENAIYIPLITGFLATIVGNITPLTTKLYIFAPLFWIYLFLGSILLPVSRGIVLTSVDKKYNGSANAVSTLAYNVFGKLPGPNLYAFYKSKCSDPHSRIPFWLILNMSVISFIFILICFKFHREKFRKLRNRDSTEEEKIFSFNEEKEETKKE